MIGGRSGRAALGLALAIAVSAGPGHAAPPPAGPPAAVFLGSSTTAGVGATRADRRWTTLLCRLLGWRELNQGLAGSAVLARGDGTGPLPMNAYRHVVEGGRPATAFVMFGANEAINGLPPGPGPDTYQGRATDVLGWLALKLPPERVWALAPQPNRATATRRVPYDAALAGAARAAGVRFLPQALAALPEARFAEHLADDLHLNDLGHARFASMVADALAAAGQAQAGSATGGPAADGPLQATPAGGWWIDEAGPLGHGVLGAVEATWVGPGVARLAVFRPDGRGGFDVVYASSPFGVAPGRMRISFGGWVLAGDRLAAWTDRPCLGGTTTIVAASRHVAGGDAPADVPGTAGAPSPWRLALRASGPADPPRIGLEDPHDALARR